MKSLILVSLLSLGGFAFAEEKKCTVKGMHCEACVDMVKDRLCEGKGYDVCDVTIKKDSKPKVGTIHIKTKDKATKIDVAAMSESVKDTNYSVVCQ